MTTATFRQLLARRARLIGVGLALLIGVGFTTMTILFGEVLEAGFRNSAGAEYRAIDFVVESDGESLDAETIAAIEATDGVADVQVGSPLWIEAEAGGRTSSIVTVGAPDPGGLRDGLVLASGWLPESTGEITLRQSTARKLRVDVGGTVSLAGPYDEGTGEATSSYDVRVVGLWSGEGRFGPEEVTGFLSEDAMSLWSDQAWVATLYVVTSSDADQAAVETALGEIVGDRVTVTTAEEQADGEMEEFADETAIQRLGVSAFGVIALVVAGIVVSNTFAILVAQRTREIALFRCAGATAGQMRRMVLAEAVSVGLAASAAGVAGAVVVTNVALRIVDWRFDFPTVPSSVGVSLPVVVVPFMAGMLVAVGAAWAPARTATRIDPLRALRMAHLPADTKELPGPLQIGLSLLLLLGGVALLLGGVVISRAGSREMGVLAGIAGGMGTWLGIVFGASILLPATVAAFGRIVSQFGVPARVAASNSVRNPRRTTATTIALVIGVALVTMMSVGAETLKASMFGEIDVQTPWDLEISNAGNTVDTGAFAAFTQPASGVDGVAALVALGWLEAEVPGRRPEDSILLDARVVDPEDLAAVWRDDDAISGFGPGVALTPRWVLDLAGIANGGTLPLKFGGEQREFQAVETSSFESVLIAGDDLPGVTTAPVVDTFWLRLDDEADTDRVLDDLYDLADAQGVAIDAGDASDYRQTLTSALDALLLVITALLGVAVLIAVVGVGNTLSLSVIERTRESALLRALGFTRRQLRQSLAVEGVLLALIGSLMGIVLGAVYGWIGAMTVVGNAWPVTLAFPVGRIGLVLAVAIACGLVASVLPARRAAGADPIVALADV